MRREPNQRLESIRFTHEWYRDFLEWLQTAGYEFQPFDADIGAGDVLLRHDLDLSLDAALAMARIEADLDVQATYFVLVTSALYNPLEGRRRDAITEIEELGHDVGLHFSTHEYWDHPEPPDEPAIRRRVAAEQSVLGTVTSTAPDTVSFHVPPDWVLDRSFESFRSAYAPAFFSDVEYVSDSEQRVRESPPDVEEWVADAQGGTGVGDEGPQPKQILIHPGLWGERDRDFESRISQRVDEACAHMQGKAEREFLQDVYN